MINKEKVLYIKNELKKSKPQPFIEKFSQVERGTYFVLGHLSHSENEVISSDLSNALNVSTARMAKLLNNMEKKGLIIKINSLKDARKTIIKLTEKGKKISKLHEDTLDNLTMFLIEKVGFDDMKEFIRISYKIKNSIPFDGSILKEFRKIDEQM